MTRTCNNEVFSAVHFGDLHITRKDEGNYRDFLAIIGEVNANFAGKVDIAVLPGDNAEDGTKEQFQLVRDACDKLKVPLKIIPGDHDYKPRNLDAYFSVLQADALPYAVTIGAYRSLFLDVVSEGSGGPDFRLGTNQMRWLKAQIEDAEGACEHLLVFMHCYPEDLKEGADAVAALFARPSVIAVDTGHTHYNELVNQNGTVYAATRSTGQIEEGPAGFSILAADSGAVSWRFKPLGSGWPFVVITAPSDKRLVLDAATHGEIIAAPFEIRALVFGGEELERVEYRIGDGAWTAMSIVPGTALWKGQGQPQPKAFSLTVRATARNGDHRVARGEEGQDEAPEAIKLLFENKPLLWFTAAITLFHFANAAMLPLAGEKLAQAHEQTSTLFMASCIVTAQIVMVPMAILVGRKADDWGRKPLFLVGFAVLPIRGLLFAIADNPYAIIAIQVLDGIGAGIFGALFYIVISDLTRGTGRFNLAQGASAASWGLGAALSNAVAGSIVNAFGFSAAFFFLALCAAAALAIYLLAVPETRDFRRNPEPSESAILPQTAGA